MRGVRPALAILAALLAALSAYMFTISGLGVTLTDDQAALMHFQSMDVQIGLAAAVGAVVMLAALAVVIAIDAKGK